MKGMKSSPILQRFLTFGSDIINNYSHPNILTKTINYFIEQLDKNLTPDEASLCEGPIYEAECLNALNTMKEEKTPGVMDYQQNFTKRFGPFLVVILFRFLTRAMTLEL